MFSEHDMLVIDPKLQVLIDNQTFWCKHGSIIKDIEHNILFVLKCMKINQQTLMSLSENKEIDTFAENGASKLEH